MTFKVVPSFALAAAGLLACVPATRADSIFNYNVVTRSNATLSNVHLHGKAVIGGNLNIGSLSEFGADVSGSGIKLSVVGNISSSSGDYLHLPGSGGVVNYGGTLSKNQEFTNKPSEAVKTTVSASAFSSEMVSDSSAFGSLTKNDTYSSGVFSATTTSLTALGNTAVFSLTASDLAAQNTNFSLVANASVDAIIINVTGTSISEAQINFNGDWASYTGKVIWNFTNATAITLSSTSWYGTILAPNATLNKTSNDIYGGVYVNCLVMSGGEIHQNLYTGTIPVITGSGSNPPLSTPLPASAWSGGAVLAIAGLAGARRRKTTAV